MCRYAWLAGLLLTGVVPATAQTLLAQAEAGNSRAALAALASEGNPDAADASGTTALMWAAWHGDAALAAALLAAGAAPDTQNAFGTFALMEAANAGAADVVQRLLAAGADASLANPEGQTALMVAARAGQVGIARALLSAGAEVNAREQWGGQSALMWAAAQSQADMVQLLLAAGADPALRGSVRRWERKIIGEPRPKDLNKGGFTALLYAAREGCIACAEHLLAAGADPDLADPERVTPLNLALLNLHFDLAIVLIDAGANVDKWDLFGRTPLYMAADVNTLPLKGNGEIAVLPSTDGHSALDVARRLLAAGADPNIRLRRRPPYRDVPQDRGSDRILDRDATPLLRAARAGDVALVELLLTQGALVDLPSKEGVTPLMAAAGVDFGLRVTRGRDRGEADLLATLQLLLAAGADINARMRVEPGRRIFINGAQFHYGFTYADYGRRVPSPAAIPHQAAIHGAARLGLNEVIEWLASNGADLTVADADGKTPLDLAAGDYTDDFITAPPEPLPATVALLERLTGTGDR